MLLLTLFLGQVAAQQLPLAGTYGSHRGSLKNAITPEVTQFAQDVLANGSVPGMSLGVVHLDGRTEFEPFGIKTEDGVKMTTDTLFNIASCSKAFLASSVGILMDDFANGRNVTALPDGVTSFDWHTKVKAMLPDDWKLMDDWATEQATFRDILSHQSGLPRHDLSYQLTDSPLDVIRNMRHLRPAFQLRQRYHYNNQMYMLGSYIVSTYSGKPYTDFVKARIWTPLNMSSTTFYEAEASYRKLLTQTWTKSGRKIPYWFGERHVELNAGPGGIISSVTDLAKWVRTLLNEGIEPVTNATIIPKATFEAETSGQIVVNKRPAWPEFSISAYGFGWHHMSYQGHEIIEHAGAIPGFSAEILLLPTQNVGIIALANADEKHSQELAIAYRVIEDYLGLEHKASTRYASSKRRGLTASQDGVVTTGTLEFAPRAQIHPKLLPLSKYAGKYSSPGYPNLTLCDPATSGYIVECREVLDTFKHLENISASSHTLYMALPSVWVSHARLRRIQDDTFGLSATYIFPHGYGKDKSPFETSETGETEASAQFVVEHDSVVGLAINGLVGELTELQRIGGTVEETAEIWFKRV